MPVTALSAGDPFPQLNLPAVGGGRLAMPRDAAGRPAVLLFYRGRF